jgi:hypothetical protein
MTVWPGISRKFAVPSRFHEAYGHADSELRAKTSQLVIDVNVAATLRNLLASAAWLLLVPSPPSPAWMIPPGLRR